jgi:hypothetical protein
MREGGRYRGDAPAVIDRPLPTRSLPRKRESRSDTARPVEQPWIPAFAGMSGVWGAAIDRIKTNTR